MPVAQAWRRWCLQGRLNLNNSSHSHCSEASCWSIPVLIACLQVSQSSATRFIAHSVTWPMTALKARKSSLYSVLYDRTQVGVHSGCATKTGGDGEAEADQNILLY